VNRSRVDQAGWHHSDHGFTAAEAAVAALLGSVVVLAILGLFNIQASASRTTPALVDIVERARAAAGVVAADLAVAGAGFGEGPGAGALGRVLPPVNPRRLGARSPDPPGAARSDVITVTFVPPGAYGATLQGPSSGPLALAAGPPCPSSPLCGLSNDDTVVGYDGTGQHDYFRVAAPAGGGASLVPRQLGAPFAYVSGARLVRVETHTYYFDSALRQLRHYDGFRSDVPAIDNVVAADFAYWADDKAPAHPKPLAGQANCLYDATGVRLPWSGAPAGGGAELIPLPLAALGDGPWCGSGDNRFDADLLRLRRIRMTLTLQGPDDLRAGGPLFRQPGHTRSAHRLVPDLTIAIDVAPRNLNGGR
jgi:hypothetical protein